MPAPCCASRRRRDVWFPSQVAAAKDAASRELAAAATLDAAADAYKAAVEKRRGHSSEGLVSVRADAPPRLRAVPKQVDERWLAKLDALRPRAADFALVDDDALALNVPAPPPPRLDAAADVDVAYTFPSLPF